MSRLTVINVFYRDVFARSRDAEIRKAVGKREDGSGMWVGGERDLGFTVLTSRVPAIRKRLRKIRGLRIETVPV